jgi:hypothetical protein
MKKLGTPIGAGPGRERENPGVDGLGTPLPVGSEGPGLALRFLPSPLLPPLLVDDVEEDEWLEELCFLGPDFGFGALVEPECEVVVEDEEGEVGLVPVLGGLVRVGVELVAVLVEVLVLELVEVGVQDSLSEATVPWTGRLKEETGVPGGTLT